MKSISIESTSTSETSDPTITYDSVEDAFNHHKKTSDNVVPFVTPNRVKLDRTIHASADPLSFPVEAEVRRFLEIVNAQAARAIGDATNPGVLQISRLDPRDEKSKLVPYRFAIGDVDRMSVVAIGPLQTDTIATSKAAQCVPTFRDQSAVCSMTQRWCLRSSSTATATRAKQAP